MDIDECLKQLAESLPVIDWVEAYGSLDSARNALRKIKDLNLELVGFDVPSDDETFVSRYGYIEPPAATRTLCLAKKRFIVRTKQPRRFVYEEVAPDQPCDAFLDLTNKLAHFPVACGRNSRNDYVRVRLVEEPTK